jgi:hypothetical protein
MSGFLGIYRQDGAAFDERLLDGIRQRLRFRGPDAQNVFVGRDFSSCFSLLEVCEWNVFFPLAIEHSVSGLVAGRLQQLNYETVPQDWREKLQSRMRAQHLFTLSMTAELFRIRDAFSKSHIETLLVKGPIVSFLAYGDAAMRSYVDLDLLVRHDDILSAAQQMLALGFEPAFPLAAIRAGKIPGEYLFRRPGTQRIIELHTERSFRYYPVPLPLADFFARQRLVALDGRDVPVLSLEDDGS